MKEYVLCKFDVYNKKDDAHHIEQILFDDYLSLLNFIVAHPYFTHSQEDIFYVPICFTEVSILKKMEVKNGRNK